MDDDELSLSDCRVPPTQEKISRWWTLVYAMMAAMLFGNILGMLWMTCRN